MPEFAPPEDPLVVRMASLRVVRTPDGRDVLQVMGAMVVPPADVMGQYVGPNGYTADIEEATDIRGEPGATIIEGETVEVVGPKGDPGVPGKSAYQEWLDAGNSGDTAAFLMSLIGTPGSPGTPGNPGADGEDGAKGEDGVNGTGITAMEIVDGNLLVTLTSGETINAGRALGLEGERGAPGEPGEMGPKGNPGTNGRGIDYTTIDVAGHLQVTFTDGVTTDVGKVVGPQGTPGAQGIPGLKGEKGDQGRGISFASIGTGRLVLTYTDGGTADLGNVIGPKGDPGTNGTNGVSPVFSIGTVSAVAAGGAPTVTVTGTSSSPVLNFGIPRGADGTSFAVGNPTVTALSTAEKNGTAFQPRSGGACMVNITGNMTGVLNVSSAITVSISATQNGTYVPVSLFSLTLNLAGIGISDAATGAFLVPSGWWVKVTQTGVSLLANIAMNRIVWNV